MTNKIEWKQVLNLTVIVSAFGYFVDIFDLLLFGIVRVASLKDIGVPDADLLKVGVHLLNYQMVGVLLGGIFWGVLGDKKGRVSVLFGSIFIYSLANILNAFVYSVESYAVLRFIAGFGLAGELGVAITLVSEVLPKSQRGYGTGIVAGVGLLGSVAAALVAGYTSWRAAYIIGGVLGFILLILRFKIRDSVLFEKSKTLDVSRGNFLQLFSNRERFFRYLRVILIGVPIWCTVGIMITFAPEFGRELGVVGGVTAAKAILFNYIGVAIGDLVSGFWSQAIQSRKKVLAYFLILLMALLLIHLSSHGVSATHFYAMCVALGFATGYWAVFMTTASEQFGTNLRATVTTTVPNFVRGSVAPMTLLFSTLQSHIGIIASALTVAAIGFSLGFLALYRMEESYSKDLDFLEAKD